MLIRLSFVLLSALLFNGCATKEYRSSSQPLKPLTPINLSNKALPEYKPKEQNWITIALYEEYKKWYKTPYEYGGCDSNGVDCSSLVQIIYRDAFKIDLPRTTKLQAQKGYQVNRNSTKEGDLVFFKTGYKVRHSGIIIEKDKFIHTSEKNGVTVSSLNNPYWREKYWQTRRILP